MSDYIKRKDAIIAITSFILNCGFCCDTHVDALYSAEVAKTLISDIQPADVVERASFEHLLKSKDNQKIEVPKAGRWLTAGGFWNADYWCSNCGMIFNYAGGIQYLVKDKELPNYCPNCGAKMEDKP